MHYRPWRWLVIGQCAYGRLPPLRLVDFRAAVVRGIAGASAPGPELAWWDGGASSRRRADETHRAARCTPGLPQAPENGAKRRAPNTGRFPPAPLQNARRVRAPHMAA